MRLCSSRASHAVDCLSAGRTGVQDVCGILGSNHISLHISADPSTSVTGLVARLTLTHGDMAWCDSWEKGEGVKEQELWLMKRWAGWNWNTAKEIKLFYSPFFTTPFYNSLFSCVLHFPAPRAFYVCVNFVCNYV